MRTERFVQSSGIFSDGMGSDAQKRIRFERTYSPRDEVKNTIAVPKIKKEDWQVRIMIYLVIMCTEKTQFIQ